ncbi:M23 family metallopeptidase [Pedococcus sp. KACC 23699]|uniref:M23 family metallopeptidase n=1 Tax=Pedococcus sp. KACC 23699 TaxID=3149228 RepID=A0AAU7JQX3_9MICO
MKALVPVLLPAAATALAVTTVSTVVAPTSLSVAPPPATVRETVAPPLHPRATKPPPTAGRDAPAASSRLAPRGRWVWPLEPPPDVVRPFIRPASTWGAGHRGVDLDASAGSAVRAVDAGVVTHVGVVAGRGTVTVLHRSGLRSTYEPVEAAVSVGDEVTRGQQLGTVAAGGHCSPAACLHLGALRGSTYVDPLTLLGATRVRLLPLR